MRQFKQGTIILFLVLGLSTFQNCSNGVEFADLPDATLLSVSLPCTSATGDRYETGESWSVVTPFTEDVICTDSSSLTRNFEFKQDFTCENGEPITTGTQTYPTENLPLCPAMSVSAAFVPAKIRENMNSALQISSTNNKDVSYVCKGKGSQIEMAKGKAPTGAQVIQFNNVIEEIICEVYAENSVGLKSTPQSATLSLDCESSGKLLHPMTRQCVEFSCLSYRVLSYPTDGSVLEVPARTVAGECFAVKLLSKIPKGNSSLTTVFDNDVLANAHDRGGGIKVPYLLGRANFDFKMLSGIGARQVKLAGSENALDRIIIDNFVLVGLQKKSAPLDITKYHAYGTLDSTINAAKNAIQFMGVNVPFSGTALAGTETVSILNVTNQVSTDEVYSIDVRALDAGGLRELSDVYLIFQ
jgi:hypothetical protein